MNPTQVAVLPDGKPIIGTISGDKILGTEQTFRVQSETETIPLILVSRTLIIGEYDEDMAVDISAGAERAGYQVCAVNASAAGLLVIGLGGDASLELQPSTSQLLSWTGSEWQADFSLTAGGSDNEEKFLRFGENGPEWYSATPVGPSTADDLPDGTTKGITTLAGKTAADNVGAASGADTQSKLKTVIGSSSETNAGVAELATAAEIVTGTDTGRVPNVANLKTALASDGMWLTKRTKMPDGDTSVEYFNDDWSATTGWTFSNSTHAESGGVITLTPSSSVTGSMYYASTTFAGKLFLVRCKRSTASTNQMRLGYWDGVAGSAIELKSMAVGTDYTVVSALVPLNVQRVYILADVTGGTVPLAVDTVWIGDYSYLAGTLSEEAARISNQLGDSAGTGTKAYSTLTSTGTAPADANTITLGGKVYTFKTTLGTTEGQVLIGDTASAAAALDNLKLAINGDAGTFGVNHYCAAANPLVTATTNTDTTQVVEATATGLMGNLISTAKSSTQLSWANPDGGTDYLSRGTNDVTQKILASAANYIAGGGTRPAAAKVELTLTTLIGYETTVDVASGATFTLPSGGTWIWNVYGYGATISSAKRGSSAGGTTLTVAGANASVGYRRYA